MKFSKISLVDTKVNVATSAFQAMLPAHHLKELWGVSLKQVDFGSHSDAKGPVFDC